MGWGLGVGRVYKHCLCSIKMLPHFDCILSLYFHRCREVIRDLRGLTEDSHFTDEAREAK